MLEFEDTQGLLIYGYGKLRYANYMLLQLSDSNAQNRAWLESLLPKIKDATYSPKEGCVNLAFGKSGLEKLGVEVSYANGFSRPFIEGMDTPHRNRILGDYSFNASSQWEWGAAHLPHIDVLLMSFEPDLTSLEESKVSLVTAMEAQGIAVIQVITTSDLGSKEHFGFEDGLSQPVMKGSGKDGCDKDMVNPGEFIFGYDNQYDKAPRAPALSNFNLGRNGSYMVFRQLRQEIKLFWAFLRDIAESDEQAIYFASKMVGRWPDGKPFDGVAIEDQKGCPVDNAFLFDPNDLNGHGCPVGSHIRRTNPRDSIDGNPEQSLTASNKHRILRRGRPYGEPFSATLDINEMMTKEEDNTDRGLNFICFNTNIERQFEFIQHTWCNNKKFDGLYDEVDPIVGVQGEFIDGEYQAVPTQFKIPESKYRKRIVDLPIFIKMRGGAYFFFPGMNAIRHLAGK